MEEHRGRPRVAFQGERGAFSEEAATGLMGREIELVPRSSFDALFMAINEDTADYLLAPIENSLAGSVHRSYDLLLESSLMIVGEVILRIEHHLIGCSGATFEQIRTVESHPIALAQCERFFAAYPRIECIASQDTAGSVRAVMQQGGVTRAAIAGRRAVETYGGIILRENIEDHPENYTRFLLLAASPPPSSGANKLSLVIELTHRPGSLYRALEPFARRNTNLLKIESRPVKGRPWQYRFYLDLEASMEDAGTREALDELREIASAMRILGCYLAARLPSAVAQHGTPEGRMHS